MTREDRQEAIHAELRDPRTCTLEAIGEAVAYLGTLAQDEEMAHGFEDDIRDAVLEAIENGAGSPHLLARAVRRTSDIEFGRWCA